MRPHVLGALFTLLIAVPLSAQNGREAFVTPDTALDAVHAEQQQAFLVLRDSVSSIAAAGAQLMSAMTSSSSLAWMRARANAVSAACARSEAPLANAKTVVAGAVWPIPGQQKAQTNLLKAMPGFANELSACQKTWNKLAADTSQVALREMAPYQMKLLQDTVDKFNRTAGAYLSYIGVKFPTQGQPKP